MSIARSRSSTGRQCTNEYKRYGSHARKLARRRLVLEVIVATFSATRGCPFGSLAEYAL
jgi:hypothetical protein